MPQIFFNPIQKEYYCPACKFEHLSHVFKYCPNCRESLNWFASPSPFLFDWDDALCLLRPKVEYAYLESGLKKGHSTAVYYKYDTRKVLLANGMVLDEQSVSLYGKSLQDDEETGANNVAAYLLEYGTLFKNDVKIKVGSTFMYSPEDEEPTAVTVHDLVWSYEHEQIFILFKRGLKIANLVVKEEPTKFCPYNYFRTSIYKTEEIKNEL